MNARLKKTIRAESGAFEREAPSFPDISAVLAYAVFLVAILLNATWPAAAQTTPPFDHPLFSGPVHESGDAVVDFQHALIELELTPDTREVRGRITLQLTTLRPRFVLAEFPFTEQPIDSLRFVYPDTTSFLLLPADTTAWDAFQGPETGVHFAVIMNFHLRTGFFSYPLGRSKSAWEAVWTSFEPGMQDWLPVQPALDDWFSSEFRFSAPSDWQVYLPGISTGKLSGKAQTIYSSSLDGRTTVLQIGFLAFQPDSFQSVALTGIAGSTDSENPIPNSNGPGLSVPDADGPDRNALEAGKRTFQGIFASAQKFIARHTLTRIDSTGRVLLIPNFDRFTFSGAGLTVGPLSITVPTESSAKDSYRVARAAARTWEAGVFRLSGITDNWLPIALAEFMAVEFVRVHHGGAAALEILYNLRASYFREFENYQRPLVWDRWEYPSDMDDAHARGKGVWILRMLAGRIGIDSFWDGVARLANMGMDMPIGTEELRLAMEEAASESLEVFFDSWIYSSGHPVIDSRWRYDAKNSSLELDIEQLQSGFLVPASFSFSLPVETASLSGVRIVEIGIDSRMESKEVRLPVRPLYALVDPGATLLIAGAGVEDPAEIVSSLRRKSDIASQYALARRLERTSVDRSILLGLAPVLDRTQDPLVLSRLMRLLGRMAPADAAERRLLAYASDSSAAVRSAAIQALGRFTRSTRARNRVLEAADSDQNSLVLAAAVESLVRLDSSLAWTVLQSALITPSEGDIVRRGAIGLLAADPAIPDRDVFGVLSGMIDDPLPDQTRAAAIRSLARAVQDSESVFPFVRHWRREGPTVRAALIDVLESADDEALSNSGIPELLADWFHDEPLPDLRRRLERLLRSVQSL